METIAIVEDDSYIGDLLEELLEKEEYHVIRAYSGTEAVLLFDVETPDLILLDLMLPGMNGEDVLKRVQKKGIPVIVLSAKADIQNKVALLLGGAADYITKPFITEELLARIKVQLRGQRAADKMRQDFKTGEGNVCRTGALDEGASAYPELLTCGGLTLDLSSRKACVGEETVRLTKTEFAILKLLMKNQAQVLTKSQILDAISNDTPDCVESSLKVHISNLRKKLREISGSEYIEAVWGIGFQIRP